ncbi:MAG: hypothetical protein N0A16_07770 [Blastocatellia bacterium]|nr:hypothetical protein [Blastocatellia bacterium]MCS7157611.1 hypothetical protein [Blastocatellia bacterium]MCX7751876.1 hypothetical protein [Blastocatellia bacterium]MDW8166982.1 hypothetical protein [Acidobacteriota bacterium]MDW8257086.1 hypothetical protein [Acidobacteriota bacterium]
MSHRPINVRTYAGYRGEQRPTAFERDGRWVLVEEIIEEVVELSEGRVWRRFRVRAEGGLLLTLRRDERLGAWFLEEERKER